jgi:hypothetical protein
MYEFLIRAAVTRTCALSPDSENSHTSHYINRPSTFPPRAMNGDVPIGPWVEPGTMYRRINHHSGLTSSSELKREMGLAATKAKFNCSKPSLVRLSLIRIELRNMKNCVHSWVHTLGDVWHSGTRRISDCVQDSWRNWNHARKYPRLDWAGWRRPWISTSEWVTNSCTHIFPFISISTAYITEPG